MSKVLRGFEKLSEPKTMKQEEMQMQGISSRVQIRQDLKEQAARPASIKSTSKRLAQPVENPEFLGGVGPSGRMNQTNIRKMQKEDFGKQAESLFGSIGQQNRSDDDLYYL